MPQELKTSLSLIPQPQEADPELPRWQAYPEQSTAGGSTIKGLGNNRHNHSRSGYQESSTRQCLQVTFNPGSVRTASVQRPCPRTMPGNRRFRPPLTTTADQNPVLTANPRRMSAPAGTKPVLRDDGSKGI